jgi:hypothetical protein
VRGYCFFYSLFDEKDFLCAGDLALSVGIFSIVGFELDRILEKFYDFLAE